MTIRIGINGFGRIGRLAFRRIQNLNGIEVVAINDLSNIKMLSHLLKYDTTQGRFKGDIQVKKDYFEINKKPVKILAIRNISDLPWKELNVDIVLECTGLFNSKKDASNHLKSGAKRVIISAPAGNDMPTIVYNTNHETLKSTDTIISAASCTTNCLAPMAKVLNDNFTIIQGFMTTIHAYTSDQMVLDGAHSKEDLRRARAASCNIVPNSTGAAKAIGMVIPELNGKLDGSAQRVPVPAGSITELVTILKEKVSCQEINIAMKKATNLSYGYNDEEIVSSDVVGMSYGSLFDATQTRVITAGNTQLVKTVAWYDNEMSYTSQLVRTLEYFAKL